MHSVTKTVRWEMAHMLDGYDGQCSNVHGHSYSADITVEQEINKDKYMVLDLSALGALIYEILGEWDHSFAYNENSLTETTVASFLKNLDMRVTKFEAPTTAEYMAELIGLKVRRTLKYPRVKVTVHETATGSATWKN